MVSFTQNRELSWLKFNDRVLSEAMDETVPLLERLKFVSIFTSNLDEFFMIRVGSLFDLMNLNKNPIDNKSGMTPKEQLDSIYNQVKPLYAKRQHILNDIEKEMRAHGIYRLSYHQLETSEEKYIKQYYKASVEPIISPQIVDTHHPFPHLQNKVIHIGAIVEYKGKSVFAVIPVPTSLPKVVYLPGNDLRFIPIEEIISQYADNIFSPYTCKEKVVLCVTRNADINPDDETFDFDEYDFRKKMKKILHKRKRLAPVRLELSNEISLNFKEYLCQRLPIDDSQIFYSKSPMDLSFAFELPGKLPQNRTGKIVYKPFTPQMHKDISANEGIIKKVNKQDLLLSYPFESMEPFLQMIREAANDPAVISIKITIYRLARKTKLIEYLCAAAENGKDVTVLIELRARFDEQNNIDWSERLEEAGCNIIFGFEDYKVHSKICLITRKERGEIKYITQVGTGNYNESTAAMYTDLSLLTSNQSIGKDANEFFKNMAIGNLLGHYEYLIVAPVSLKATVLKLIKEETLKGSNGKILIKINSITDMDIIKKLQAASEAGVSVQMIVRGICCIVPGISGKTENLSVTSIVGRFLEHSRVYCFGTGSEEKMYISSADFMTRNTERRVEVACPILDQDVKEKIHSILDLCLYDNVKARVLKSDGNYYKKGLVSEDIDSQKELMDLATKAAILSSASSNEIQTTSIFSKFIKFLLN